MAKYETESDYQKKLKKRIKERIPGCIIMKNDCNDIPGIPDLTVLYKDHWAFLECKRSESEVDSDDARHVAQEYYINKARSSSFGSFIFPENEEVVLNEMARSFGL